MFINFSNIDGLVDSFFNNRYESTNYEIKDDTLEMVFDVPGLSKDDFEISAEYSYLEIKGKNDERKFAKKVKLGTQWDVSKTSASVKDGVLKVSIPKYTDMRKRVIDIKVC